MIKINLITLVLGVINSLINNNGGRQENSFFFYWWIHYLRFLLVSICSLHLNFRAEWWINWFYNVVSFFILSWFMYRYSPFLSLPFLGITITRRLCTLYNIMIIYYYIYYIITALWLFMTDRRKVVDIDLFRYFLPYSRK